MKKKIKTAALRTYQLLSRSSQRGPKRKRDATPTAIFQGAKLGTWTSLEWSRASDARERWFKSSRPD